MVFLLCNCLRVIRKLCWQVFGFFASLKLESPNKAFPSRLSMNIKHFQKIFYHLSSRFCQKVDFLTSIWTVDLKQTDYFVPMWLPNQKYQGRKHGEKFRFRQKKFWSWNRYRDLIVVSVADNETRFRSYTTGRAHGNCRKMEHLIFVKFHVAGVMIIVEKWSAWFTL